MMYCPKCATANADEVKFCRSCGANLSLVPQAMTGQLPESRETGRRGRHGKKHGRDEDKLPNLAKGITQLVMGVGFLAVSLAIFFSPGGKGWWWAMLFPAFSLIGKGVADIVTARTAMNLPQPVADGYAARAQYGRASPPQQSQQTLIHCRRRASPKALRDISTPREIVMTKTDRSVALSMFH